MQIETKKGISYILKNGKPVSFKPWLGDLFSFAYDRIMAGSIFPKKLGADMQAHGNHMKEILSPYGNCSVLELAAGSGSASGFLPPSVQYTGSDISPGLLKLAVKKFRRKGFENAEFYLWGAEEMPFATGSFDLCMCLLALNFFPDLKASAEEIHRVLKENGSFICCVPVPGRKEMKKTIRGKLRTEEELNRVFTETGFQFEPHQFRNGSIFYFRAVRT